MLKLILAATLFTISSCGAEIDEPVVSYEAGSAKPASGDQECVTECGQQANDCFYYARNAFDNCMCSNFLCACLRSCNRRGSIELNWINVSEMPGRDTIGTPNPIYIHRPVILMTPNFLVGAPQEPGASGAAAWRGMLWNHAGGIHGYAMAPQNPTQAMAYGRK